MESKQEYRVIRLDRDNYVTWKWQFVRILEARGLDRVLSGEETDVKITKQALALLGSAISEDTTLKIINCTTFMDAWKTIESCYENKTAYEPQALYRRLYGFKIDSVQDVSKGVSEIQGIVSQLKNLQESVSDTALIGAILSALPTSFEPFIRVWRNLPDQKLEGFVAKLMAEATTLEALEKQDTKALMTEGRKPGFKGKGNRKKGGAQGNSRGKNIKDLTCHYCGIKGHFQKDCRKRAREEKSGQGKPTNKGGRSNNEAQPGSSKEPGDITFSLISANSMLCHDENIWTADSGCTHHMSPFKSIFNNFKPTAEVSYIYTASNDRIPVEGQGEVATTTGTLRNVLYVPLLGQNLFSMSSAAKHDIRFVGLQDKVVFYHNDDKLFTASLFDKLYLIRFEYAPKIGHSNYATLNEWHARFGHVSEQTIHKMSKNKIVDGLDIATSRKETCEDCQLNKSCRVHHPLKDLRDVKAGQVLHMDTAGPSNIVSKGNSKYIVLCKDEASKYRQIAFTATKDQIPDKVKEFISRAQLETGRPVLKIVTDNGTEFVNSDVRNFLSQRGIIHERSTPMNPMQNGFIERDIRTLKEASKTLLNHSKLNINLWAEAVNCALYALNRVINKSNPEQTPYEMWFGSKPNVKNMRIFGELAVLKKPDHKITSWGEKGARAIFIGYTDKFNTYRFLNAKDKIEIACDASFLGKMSNGMSIAPGNEDILDIEFYDASHENVSPDGSSTMDTSSDVGSDTSPNVSTGGSVSPLLNDQADSDDTMQDQFHDADGQHGLPRSSTPVVPPNPSNRLNRGAVVDELPRPAAPNQRVRPTTKLTKQQVESIVEANRDKTFFIQRNGQSVPVRVADLYHDAATDRWRDRKTGQFISRDYIQHAQREWGRAANSHSARALIAIPKNYIQAMESSDYARWGEAMDEEMKSLVENDVFEEVDQDRVTKKLVGSRWVYTIKYKQNGVIDKFKARVVAKGYSQVYGIDYLETYCSVVHVMSTRIILNYAASMKLEMKQFDIKTAFLYGKLKEEIYMQPPEGYCKPNTVWKLNRSLYGLKQSPRMWNERFSTVLLEQGLEVCRYDQSVFYRLQPLLILIVYVDDGLIFAKNQEDINYILAILKGEFQMRELDISVYRGLEIKILNTGLFVHQETYTKKILESFCMANAKPATNPVIVLNDEDEPLDDGVPYRNAVGSLAYLADSTRPDIAYGVNQVARKMANPTQGDWKKIKQIFRYLRGTTDYGLMYSNEEISNRLIGYSDSDFAGHYASSKSTTGYVIMLNGSLVHWKTQLQRHVTLSSTESEVIALCALTKELAWIRRMLIELDIIYDEPAVLMCDNQSALHIVQAERATNRTRHLRAQHDFVREQIEEGELELEYVRTDDQLADMLTKTVATGKFTSNVNSTMSSLSRTMKLGVKAVAISVGVTEARPTLIPLLTIKECEETRGATEKATFCLILVLIAYIMFATWRMWRIQRKVVGQLRNDVLSELSPPKEFMKHRVVKPKSYKPSARLATFMGILVTLLSLTVNIDAQFDVTKRILVEIQNPYPAIATNLLRRDGGRCEWCTKETLKTLIVRYYDYQTRQSVSQFLECKTDAQEGARAKRGIGSEIVVAATNFITNFFHSGSIESKTSLATRAGIKAMQFLTEKLSENFMEARRRDTNPWSSYTDNRTSEYQPEKDLDQYVWTANYIYRKQVQGNALLHRLASMCKRGKLATDALSMLTGYGALGAVNPENTILDDVIVDEATPRVEFVYRVLKTTTTNTISNSNNAIIGTNNTIVNKPVDLTGIAFVIAAILIVITFGVMVCYIRRRVESDSQHHRQRDLIDEPAEMEEIYATSPARLT